MIPRINPIVWILADFLINVWKANKQDGYGCICHKWGIIAQTEEEWKNHRYIRIFHKFFPLSHHQLRTRVAMYLNHLITNGADIYMVYPVLREQRRRKIDALPTVWLTVDSDSHPLAEYEAAGLLPNIHVETSKGSFFDAFQLTESIEPELQQRLNSAIVRLLVERSGKPLNSCVDSAHLFRLPGSKNYKPKYRDIDGNSPSVSMPIEPRKEPYTLDEIMGILEPYLPPEKAPKPAKGCHRGGEEGEFTCYSEGERIEFAGLLDPAYLKAVERYRKAGGKHVGYLLAEEYYAKGEIPDRSLAFSRLVNDLIFRLWPEIETVQAIAEICPLNKRIPDGFSMASARNYAEYEINVQYGYLKDKLSIHADFNMALNWGV